MWVYVGAYGSPCGAVHTGYTVRVHSHGTVKVLLGYEEHYPLLISHTPALPLNGTVEAEAPPDVFHAEVNLHNITILVYVAAHFSPLP